MIYFAAYKEDVGGSSPSAPTNETAVQRGDLLEATLEIAGYGYLMGTLRFAIQHPPCRLQPPPAAAPLDGLGVCGRRFNGSS